MLAGSVCGGRADQNKVLNDNINKDLLYAKLMC